MQETQVRSLGQEEALEKEMAIHSSTIAWKIAWTEEPVGYSPWGPKESDTTERLHFHAWKQKRDLEQGRDNGNLRAGKFEMYFGIINEDLLIKRPWE